MQCLDPKPNTHIRCLLQTTLKRLFLSRYVSSARGSSKNHRIKLNVYVQNLAFLFLYLIYVTIQKSSHRNQMLSPLLLGPNQTPKICEIKYNICVQKQTDLDPMSESNPSSNIYQNDTCPQLLNTRDQKSAHLSAMFGSKVQKLQFYV